MYGVASAIVLNKDSWISLTYRAIERKQVAEFSEDERRGELL